MTEDILDSGLKATGMVYIEHRDGEGNLIEKRAFPNKVVDTGLAHIAARMSNTGTPTQMTHMAIGTGTTAPAAADTTLGAALGVRQGLAVAGGTPSGASVSYTATFGTGYNGAITEAGIFNGLTGSTMLCRSTFLVINKADADTLSITWIVSLS